MATTTTWSYISALFQISWLMAIDLMAHLWNLFMELIYGKMNGGVDGKRKGRCVLVVTHNINSTYSANASVPVVIQ